MPHVVASDSEEGDEMAGKKKYRGKVHTNYSLLDMDWVQAGFALPKALTAHAELVGDPEVEVPGGRARARSVRVTSPHGIGWTTLANVPVRDIVATACLTGLRRAEMSDGNAIDLVPFSEKDVDKARDIVQSLVRYSPKTDGLEIVP